MIIQKQILGKRISIEFIEDNSYGVMRVQTNELCPFFFEPLQIAKRHTPSAVAQFNIFLQYDGLVKDLSLSELNEVVADIDFMIQYINNAFYSLDALDFKKVLLNSCKNHIESLGRIIDNDFFVYVDDLLHIMKALNRLPATDELKIQFIKQCMDLVEINYRPKIFISRPYGGRNCTQLPDGYSFFETFK
jgi:hypothetical protein